MGSLLTHEGRDATIRQCNWAWWC